jgi:hypothetical protein
MVSSQNPEDTEAARIILKECIAQNPKFKPLLTRALASAMGGAPWIQKDAQKFGLSTPENFSVPAIQAFLKLSEQGDILSHDDCMAIKRQFDNHQVFSRKNSPLLRATQSLPIAQREQLGDCFGQHPRSVYEKSREYLALKKSLHRDSKATSTSCIRSFSSQKTRTNPEGGYLHQLNKLFRKLDIDLIKTGCAIPEGWQTPRNSQGSTEKLGAIRSQIEELLTDQFVREYLQQAQELFGKDREKMEKILTLQRELEAYAIPQDNGGTQRLDLISDTKPPLLETKLRRDLMAGKPNASIRDCWDTAVPARWPSVGTYEQWKARGLRIEQIKEEMRADLAKQDNSLADFLAIAKKTVEFHNTSLEASNLTEEMEGSDFFHRLGEFQEEDYIVSDGGNGLASSENNMHYILMQVIPKITDENLKGKSLSSLIRLLEDKLKSHLSSSSSDDIQHLNEILAIAKELKLEG